MKHKLHKFIEWICSAETCICFLRLGFALFLAIAFECFRNGLLGVTIICGICWVVFGIFEYKLTNKKALDIRKLEEEIKNKDNGLRKIQNKYQSLLSLIDTLFDYQMRTLYEDIKPLISGEIRTSVYIYDNGHDNFHCLARYSAHPVYNIKNKTDKYPNKGWLQSTWNNQRYVFECNYDKNQEWIVKCKEECKKNCLNTSCQGTPCMSARKRRLPTKNCTMLSAEELQKKTMKAKEVFGYLLKQGSCPLGIILVESMVIWSSDVEQNIEQIVIKHSNSPLEILSLHGKSLLDLIHMNEQEKDFAAGFLGGTYAK